MRTSELALGSLLIIVAAASPVDAQRPLNVDFEKASVSYADRPWGWTLGWSAFSLGTPATFTLDSSVHREGRRSLRITLADSTCTTPQTLMLQLPAEFARGRAVGLSGWARIAGLDSRAMVTLEGWKDREFAAADTVTLLGADSMLGPVDWKELTCAIEVPDEPDVHSVVISLSIVGPGASWFDDFALTLDGSPITTLPAVAAPPSRADLEWLADRAIPLITADATGDGQAVTTDLDLVGDIIGTARVVGLGESTHGTREFFQLKHRLAKYLISHLGFSVFAIEANQLAVEQINEYVQGGNGTARDVMRVMFQVWNTESMLEFVEWLRAYNAAHPRRQVRFAGYDMQDHRRPADTLRAFLERVDPPAAARVDKLLGAYSAEKSAMTPHVPDSIRAQWSDHANALREYMDDHRAEWLRHAKDLKDSLTIEWAVQAANLLRQAAWFNVDLSSPFRDSLMAANLDWYLTTIAPGERAIVWAHDVHVSHGGDSALSFNSGAQMGAYMKHAFGYDYRAFSLLTYDGAYTATRSFSDHELIAAAAWPGPEGSIEAALHTFPPGEAGVGCVVDLRGARTDSAAAWLRQPRPIRHIGYAAYDYGFEFSAVLPLEFDGILFIDHTSPSRILRK